MFGKKKLPVAAPAEGGAEARAKARRKKATRLPKGVKQLIGYDAMLRNGIASLGDGRWSATILFQDINYQLSPESHQMEIIDRWAKLINSFEAGQSVQIASYTRSRGVREILADVMMDETGDSLDHYRLDYNRLAQGKLESVSRNTSTVKTLTVTVCESDEQAAVASLNALCNNLVSQMRSIDACKATRLDREHRLRLMAEVLRPGEEFRFDERWFEHQPGRPDTKDLVCPWSIDARNPTMLDIESLDSKYLHRTMWVSNLPPELSDQLVNDLTGLRARVDVSIHLAPMDRGESVTLVRRKNAEVKMQIMDQRRKNRKQGLDPDDLPDDLADQQEQLGQLRDELRSTNQRLVDSIIVIGVSAASQEELEVACRNVKAKVNAQSCTAESLKFMQMEGLTAELPLGNNPLPMKRTLTTNSAAILIPFTTQEVFEPHGLFYGSNARSGNPILADRRSHMNSNGFVLGTSGGGKSFTVKQEIAGMFLNRDDEVIVIDPEREYLALAAAFGGQIIQISAGTGTRVNPMDIVLEDDSASDPVKDKTNNVVSMIGALIGGIDGLDPLQKGLVDQCVSNLYTRYRNQGGGVVQPTLQDLHDELQAGDQVSRYLADALNPYITGSMSGFNGQTNVDLSNRFTVFDVSGLSGELRTFGMMVVIDQVWNRVIRNKANGRRTWLYVDEFHRFFSNQYAAAQFKDIYKRARKYGLGVTGITQNVEEILDLQDAREMLSNSDFLMLLSQNSTDADALCELLTLSEEQRQYFTGVLPGQGLMKIGSAYVPFDGRIPAGGDLYRLYSTTFQERMSGTQAHHAGGTRARIGRAATGVVSSAAQFGSDRADIADSMGHTAAEMAGRAGMYGMSSTMHGVGWTAGKARRIMNRGKRALRSGKGMRKTAGKPKALSEAKPSEKIGKFAAKGKASKRIGKHIGAGLGNAGRSVKRMGSTGMGWMDEAGARLTVADDDFASKLGSATRDLTFKAARAGVKGVNSSAKFIWRHRRAPVKAARDVQATGQAAVRAARVAANFVRMAASRVIAGAASISLPILPVIAAMLAVLGVLLAVMGAFLGSNASESTVSGVPAEYEADVIRAGSICQVVTPSIIAAQIDQESNWNPKAGSSAGAQGIAQFMPSTWASAGKDGDGDGKADIWNPHDAIWSQGNYMCNLASQVETAKKSGKLTGDTLELTLAAYNAGLGSVLRYGMVPPFEETINYVRRIKELAATKYTATGTAEGGTVGSLEPKLTVSGGIVSTAGITPDTRYPWGQCTWWAATRRADIGKPIPGWGNAATWAGSAASAGYTVDGSPSAGSVIVFQPGVLGASADYGHVAMVEEVRGDGSILISESNALGLGVVSTREISASQLAAAGNGVRYIH